MAADEHLLRQIRMQSDFQLTVEVLVNLPDSLRASDDLAVEAEKYAGI